MIGTDELIRNFQNCNDTEAYKGGSLLSATQKQRACMGRAALESPGIFIMDKAGSSVDANTEVKIQADNGLCLMPSPALQLPYAISSFATALRLSIICNTDKNLITRSGDFTGMGNDVQLFLARG